MTMVQAGRLGVGGNGIRFPAGSEIYPPLRSATRPALGLHLVASELTAGIRSWPLTSTAQFSYLLHMEGIYGMRAGQGREGIRLPRLSNATVHLPFASSFTPSSPRMFSRYRN